MVGNFNTLAFSVLISSFVSLAKSVLYHTKKLYSRKNWDLITVYRVAINSDLASI